MKKKTPWGIGTFAVGCLLTCFCTALAQDRAAPERVLPQDPEAAAREWSVFSSPETGLEFQLPPGRPQESEDSNVLLLRMDPERNWRFELRRLPLEMAMGLQPEELPEGGRRPGLMSLLVDRDQRETQGVVLRQGLAPLGEAEAANYSVYYTVGAAGQLRQVALIRAYDTLYYQLTLTSAAPGLTAEEMAREPAVIAERLAGEEQVRSAVDAFRKVFNSVRLLDQGHIRVEQEQRLERTRGLMVNLTKKHLMSVLQPEQLVRIRRAGEDIGYSYMVEEPARDIPTDPGQREQVDELGARGVRIGIRTSLRRGEGWLDRATWMFAAVDSNDPDAQVTGFKEEDFRERNVLKVDGETKAENTVVGWMRGRRVPHRVRTPREGGLGVEEEVTMIDQRKLEVTFVVNGVQSETPVVRQLPAWYVPAAIEHLLPRLIAKLGTTTYLVAVYNPEKREIYQQYIDREGIKSVSIQGERREAIVVTTRLGLSGPRTRHYIEPETFRWIGSVNEETGIELWPTDRQTLLQIWESPELTPPDARQQSENE